jgi:exodeoxyribonuclease V
MPYLQSNFLNAILNKLGHEPTLGQRELAGRLAAYIFTPPEPGRHLMFMLKGYAGTGKTSMIGALVNSLPELRKKAVLLAPTGRAAKVLAQYSGLPAHTIHRKIYFHTHRPDGSMVMVLRKNTHQNTLFIVDEASMIQNEMAPAEVSSFASRNLLDDLIDYVYSSNCRLMLCGDTAQLPPVGMNISPALDPEMLKAAYSLNLHQFELTEVVRQEQESGILHNATHLRTILKKDKPAPPFFALRDYKDIKRISGNELEDALNHSLYSKGTESCVVITRTNKRANLFNRAIRSRILYRDHDVGAGDLMMVVKNNYFWLSPESEAGFIANGDSLEILRVKRTEEMYGFLFADANIRLMDYPGEPELEVKLLLSTLDTEAPALTSQKSRELFEEIMKDYQDLPSRKERMEKMRQNPYFHALQVKFAYALTCHKTQGGQWQDVFIDQGFLPDDRINHEFMRWLYTALTRATKTVFLVNFEDKFFA